MTLSGYLSEHWGLLIILTAIGLVLQSDIQLERRIIYKISFTTAMLFMYSVACYTETYLGEQKTYSVLRPILCAVNYSLVTFILVSAIMIMYPQHKKFLLIPAALNAALCFISIPTGIVFSISQDNHFSRGTLGYLTYFIDGLYLFYLIVNLFSNNKAEKEDFNLMIFMSLTSVLCLIMPLFMAETAHHWFIITIAIDILAYYIFLLQQFTKRDSLTKLLNRKSYYTDSEKYIENITAIVAMDMDGLKDINDSNGHIAGDTALKALADCFSEAADKEQRVYRIGGDEFAILCIGSNEEGVKALVERMKKNISETEYSCSVGYAVQDGSSSIDELYHKADTMLYAEKKLYYAKKDSIRNEKQ